MGCRQHSIRISFFMDARLHFFVQSHDRCSALLLIKAQSNDDNAISIFAGQLGRAQDFHFVRNRSTFAPNTIFNNITGFMDARKASGAWPVQTRGGRKAIGAPTRSVSYTLSKHSSHYAGITSVLCGAGMNTLMAASSWTSFLGTRLFGYSVRCCHE